MISTFGVLTLGCSGFSVSVEGLLLEAQLDWNQKDGDVINVLLMK